MNRMDLMSNLMYNGHMQAAHVLITSARVQNGGLAPRQGLGFGGQFGAVLIGPDIFFVGRNDNQSISGRRADLEWRAWDGLT
jgi:hypothetical protein